MGILKILLTILFIRTYFIRTSRHKIVKKFKIILRTCRASRLDPDQKYELISLDKKMWWQYS